MKLAKRVGCRNVETTDLSGGINVALLPDRIADNEMQSCYNMMYDVDSAVLKKRGGLGVAFASYPSEILSVYNDYNLNRKYVFLKDKSVYVTDSLASSINVGSLNGSHKPSCCHFGSKLYIASGDVLQVYDGLGFVRVVAKAPKAIFCFVKDNRLCCFSGTDSIVYQSGIGDGEFWDDNENDDSAATWSQIGEDVSYLLACIPLLDDIIFFKGNGEIWDLVGKYPNWSITQLGEDSGIDNCFCAANLGSKSVFVGRFGLKSVASTNKYGNLEAHDIGDKFDSLITSNFHSPTVWKMERFRSLFIQPNSNERTIVVYNYNLSAATVIEFPFVVVDFFEDNTGVAVVGSSFMYYMDRRYLTDNNEPIHCSLVTKRIVTIYDALLLTMVDCSLSASTSGDVNLNINDLNVDVKNNNRSNIKLNYTLPYLEVKLSTTDDLIFNRVSLEITDV